MAEWWYATEGASILLSKNLSVLFLKYSTKNWWLIYFICSYHFMFKCWHLDPKIRPTFSELVSLMSQTLENLAGYTQVSTFGISEAHNENFYFDIGDYCKSESKLHWYFVFPWHSYSIMWKLEPISIFFCTWQLLKNFDACDIVMVYGSYFYFSKFYSIIIYSWLVNMQLFSVVS